MKKFLKIEVKIIMVMSMDFDLEVNELDEVSPMHKPPPPCNICLPLGSPSYEGPWIGPW